MNTARSALSLILDFEATKFGAQPLVSDYMRGVHNLNPPQPRYMKLWDPNIVLTFLKRWSPAKKISLKKLTLKTLMLILLTTGVRLDTVHKLSLNTLEIKPSQMQFETSNINKQSRQGYRDPLLVLKAYPPDRRLCIFTYMKVYLARTAKFRGQHRNLFVTYQKPIHPVARDTLSRWTKLVLKEAGLDTAVFSAHSVRGASTTAASLGGASIEEVLTSAGWSNRETFARFYNRPLLNKEKLAYDEAILSRLKKN